MLVKRVQRDFKNSIATYSQFLVDEIRQGLLSQETGTWSSLVSDEMYSQYSPLGHLKMAVLLADDASGLDCSAVWPDYDLDPNQNLGGKYYEKNFPLIDFQLAKAGYLIAEVLNKAVDDC